MSSNRETIESDFPFSLLDSAPLSIRTAVVDSESREIVNQPQPLAGLTRSHSPEPPELDLEFAGMSSDEMEESFQAALQLLDESFDVGIHFETAKPPKATAPLITSVDSTSDPEDSNEPASSKQTNPQPKGRQRVSTKEQINKLRGTVSELTVQLEMLGSAAFQPTTNESDSPNGIVATGPLWQQIAARQLERRLEAENDNAKLRAMLDLQIQEAKNLKRILKRRTRIEMMENMLGVKRTKMLDSQSPDNSLHILQEMLQNTDDLYSKLNCEFAKNGMDQVSCPGTVRKANRQATNGVMLEILEKQLLPFEAKMTVIALSSALGQIATQPLQCVKDINAQVDFYAQTSQQADDAMMISYTATTAGFQDSDLRLVRIRKVLRQYVEKDRVVFICQIDSQPEHASQKKGVILRCVIRVVVEKTNPLQSYEEETTLIKSHYSVSRHIPTYKDFQPYSGVDMAIAAWDENIARVSGDLESFLLDCNIGTNLS